MASLPILIASDHAGFALKHSLKAALQETGYAVRDLGTDSEASVDYPDFGYAMAQALKEKKAERGIIICGSGIGISIAANRYPHVRAALCVSPEMARLSRAHNNANVLALGARFIDEATALACLTTFLETDFEGGRHQKRVEKLG